MPRLPIIMGACVLALVQSGPSRAADPAPLCIYEGSSYSEGALVCAQASLLIACTLTGEHAVWMVVTDKDISRLCVTPSRDAKRHRPRRNVARRLSSNNTAPSIGSPASDSAKCFTFNGKRFCE